MFGVPRKIIDLGRGGLRQEHGSAWEDGKTKIRQASSRKLVRVLQPDCLSFYVLVFYLNPMQVLKSCRRSRRTTNGATVEAQPASLSVVRARLLHWWLSPFSQFWPRDCGSAWSRGFFTVDMMPGQIDEVLRQLLAHGAPKALWLPYGLEQALSCLQLLGQPAQSWAFISGQEGSVLAFDRFIVARTKEALVMGSLVFVEVCVGVGRW